MPLASDGTQLFPVSQTNSYGRIMIAKQMDTHDELIMKAPAVVKDTIAPIYMRQMQVLRKAERYKPSYNQMKQRHDDDIVMSNLIRDARSTCGARLDPHVLRFKELRQKHPNFMPGWLKRYEDQKSMEVHETIIKKARKWIDDEPPARALHYRSVLKKTAFTKGGFPRIPQTMPRPRRRRRKKQAALPPRRGTASRERPAAEREPQQNMTMTAPPAEFEPSNDHEHAELARERQAAAAEEQQQKEYEQEYEQEFEQDYEDELYEDDFDDEPSSPERDPPRDEDH